MMDRLSILVAMMTWSVISGGLIILFLTLEWLGWFPIAIAVIVGFAIGLPMAKMIAARIKRQDPNWDENHNRPDPALQAHADAAALSRTRPDHVRD